MIVSPTLKKYQKTKRIFLALLPDPLLIKKLVQLQKKFSGQKTPPDHLHLTLAFLGNQPVSAIPELIHFMDHMRFMSFNLSLDKIGYFSKVRLNWIGPTIIPEELHQLHKTTRHFLIPAYIADKKEIFRPHITLARQSASINMHVTEPIIWHVNRLVLMQSILNTEPTKHPQYRILHEIIGDI